jgi:hypothetical protein
VSANIVVDEICADGSSVHKVDTLSESYYARTSFNEKIFSPGNVNHYVEFETLRIREVLSDEVLIITFAPERLEFGFPGILSNLGISEEELTLLYHLQQNPNSSSAHAKYTDVIRRIVNYCINAHAGGAEFNSDIDLRFRHDNGGYYEILVWAGFFHRPTVPTYTIVPCRDAVVVNIHVKQTRPKQ